MSFALPVTTAPMEAKLVPSLPEGPGWQFEPKWDGFRCLAYRDGAEVDLRARSGKPLARYFPEMLDVLRRWGEQDFVLDGELVVPLGDTLSFDALQARLHPAESRIRKLAQLTPTRLVLFDCLADGRDTLLDRPLAERRARLEVLFEAASHPAVALSPFTRDPKAAEAWLNHTEGALDGVVAKRLDGPYAAGERAMLKIKKLRSADCVVGGFRYGEGTRLVGSLLLGLYADGRLNHVGFTSAIAEADKPDLTARLQKLIEAPGFDGDAPGGPSRWASARSVEWQPLRPELVVEVRYDQVTSGRFRHGTRLLRWRPDKAPQQCTAEQLREGRPGALPLDLAQGVYPLEPGVRVSGEGGHTTVATARSAPLS